MGHELIPLRLIFELVIILLIMKLYMLPFLQILNNTVHLTQWHKRVAEICDK